MLLFLKNFHNVFRKEIKCLKLSRGKEVKQNKYNADDEVIQRLSIENVTLYMNEKWKGRNKRSPIAREREKNEENEEKEERDEKEKREEKEENEKKEKKEKREEKTECDNTIENREKLKNNNRLRHTEKGNKTYIETKTHSNEENEYILLCSDFCITLFSCKDLINDEETLKKGLIILRNDNYFIILNKMKQPYAVVLKIQKDITVDTFENVYYLYNHCQKKLKKNLNIYIQVNFFYYHYKIKIIEVWDFSKDIWNYSFSKESLKQKIINAYNLKNLYFLLSYNVLLNEYKTYVRKFITNMRKRKGKEREKEGEGEEGEAIFFFILQKEEKEIGDKKRERKDELYIETKGKVGEKIKKERKATTDIIPFSEKKELIYTNEQDQCFFKKIKKIFYLLNNKNFPFLQIYNLENYTRIFIYNCEKLNRIHFLNFLKNISDFYIKFININTLFGLYFSETEKNIVKVFKECKKNLKKTKKQICLVIDGIDIIGKEKYAEKKKCFQDNTKNVEYQINKEDRKNFSDNAEFSYDAEASFNNNRNCENNNVGRSLISTLLLCLDGIDNDTSWKGKRNKKKKMKDIENKQENKQEKKHEFNEQYECLHNNNCSMESNNNTDESDESVSNLINEKRKKEKGGKKLLGKMTEQITCDKKKLKKFYKHKYVEMCKNKTENNLSVIVLSDLDLNCFDLSFTRAGRFFHYIKYL